MTAEKRCKSILHEFCQKEKIGPPSFETWAVTNGYQAKVTIDGYPYPSGGVFSKKKEAENDAARACLVKLGIFTDPKDEGIRGGNGYDTGGETGGHSQDLRRSTPSLATPSPRYGGSPHDLGATPPSGGNVKMPKSVLHEFCQSQKMSNPSYETEATYDGRKLLGFTCVLVVNDEYFTTDNLFSNKRDAEHAAAQKALNLFGYYMRSPLYVGKPQTPSPKTPSLKNTSLTASFKNILSEHLQQRSMDAPQYDTQFTDGGFISTVNIEGKLIKSGEPCISKKLAEQNAAKAGLLSLGVKDPEGVAQRLAGKYKYPMSRNSSGKYRGPGFSPYGNTPSSTESSKSNQSWIHRREKSGFDLDEYDDVDGGYVDFQKAAPVTLKRKLNVSDEDDFFGEPEERPHKLQRVGESSENRRRPTVEKRRPRRGEHEVEEVHLGNLSVGEIWPEKRNVAIVGSEETSIPLYCQGDRDRCALEDLSTGSLVDIEPGHRLVGLHGFYVERGSHIVLQARQCEEILMPEKPDKILISCGVAVLHCIPRRIGVKTHCDVNVLLKRYLCSQAFINVVRSLAQYFRRRVIGRPVRLDKDVIVKHIREWMLEEVLAVSSMSETAIENVFQHTEKFNNHWSKFLKYDNLSEDLKQLQEAANEELGRRANSGEDQNQDRYRPWKLPKGNFHHRVLTTGIFVESAAECAMRELKEETGIKLKMSDISSSPYVDLPQADNLNPHKGDVARYYLCGIITEEEGHGQSHSENTQDEQTPPGPPTENTEAENSASVTQPHIVTETDDPRESFEEANIIRSPFVAGAVHEECKWFGVEEAIETSSVFYTIHQTLEYQKLVAKLKGIVSVM